MDCGVCVITIDSLAIAGALQTHKLQVRLSTQTLGLFFR